jgi:hypothetical protein
VLFGYPLEATSENWIHECLCDMVSAIHLGLDADVPPPDWPDIIPATHREQLRSRMGLRDRLRVYRQAVTTLSPQERQQVATCLSDQNRIADLLSCASNCEVLDDLPASVRGPVADLFGFAFDLLGALGLRDGLYQTIYEKCTHKVCPFCGCEYFDAPGAPREDLDHYLAKSLYPFAAANLRNLVPMGIKCNERYKLAQDILRNAAGVRRSSFDPYTERTITVRLERSVPFAGQDGRLPEWMIDLIPDSPECITWDEVFRLRERIRRDVLDPSFFRWLGDFAAWFKKRIGAPQDIPAVLNAMQIYADDMKMPGLTAREFLRAPVFQMLHRYCENGDERLRDFMLALVSM